MLWTIFLDASKSTDFVYDHWIVCLIIFWALMAAVCYFAIEKEQDLIGWIIISFWILPIFSIFLLLYPIHHYFAIWIQDHLYLSQVQKNYGNNKKMNSDERISQMVKMAKAHRKGKKAPSQ